jgi:chromosome segregation ATPase
LPHFRFGISLPGSVGVTGWVEGCRGLAAIQSQITALSWMVLMTKDELEQEAKRRERALSRAKATMKRVSEQLTERTSRVEELETEIRKLNKGIKSLNIKFEKLSGLNKTHTNEIDYLKTQLQEKENQNSKLRIIEEMRRTSLAEPSCDALKRPT